MWNRSQKSFLFTEIHIRIVKHLLKCYFKHIFIILVASKRQTYCFESALHLFLFRNAVNRTHPKLITTVKEAKPLGVIIDEHLSWSNHIGDLSKKISSAIGALKRIRPYISKRTALQIYQALILPHFDDCSSVWGDCRVTLSDKLQKLQNRAARAITRSNYDTSATFLLNLLFGMI